MFNLILDEMSKIRVRLAEGRPIDDDFYQH